MSSLAACSPNQSPEPLPHALGTPAEIRKAATRSHVTLSKNAHPAKSQQHLVVLLLFPPSQTVTIVSKNLSSAAASPGSFFHALIRQSQSTLLTCCPQPCLFAQPLWSSPGTLHGSRRSKSINPGRCVL